VSEDELLREALRLFGYSLDILGVSQDEASRVPMPGDPAGTGAAIPPYNFPSLSLPEEPLSPNSSNLEVTNAIRAIKESIMGLEPWGDEGVDLPPSQPAVAEQQGNSTLPEPPSKRSALAGGTGLAGGD